MAFVAVVGSLMGSCKRESLVSGRVLENPPLRVAQPTATIIDEAYPGGNTPAPVETVTAIPSESQKFTGWSGEQIAASLIRRYEEGTPQRAIPPTTYVASAVIRPSDAHRFGIAARIIEHQSPTDVAIILEGEFVLMHPMRTLTRPPNSSFMLVLVDTHTGGASMFMYSDDERELTDLLP